MELREFIEKAVRKYLNETKQVSDNEEIQQLVDIIDGLSSSNERRTKYINMLKSKFNYEYIEGNDEEYINNINLANIKSIDDFRSYSNYKLYSEKLLRLREKSVDYGKFINYSPSSISKNELISLLEKYKITSYFTKKGVYSSPTGSRDEMTIDWAGDTFDKSHILHEIAHFFDNKIHIPITYSLTDYGLTNQAECTCDSIMLYLLNKKYYKTILPKIGDYIEKNIPNWFIELSNELMVGKNKTESLLRESFESFPSSIIKTLSEYSVFFEPKFDWNQKQDEFSGKPEEFRNWLKTNEYNGLVNNIDKVISKVTQDMILLKRKKIANMKLQAFEELIIPSLGNEVLTQQLSKFEELILMNPEATVESIAKGFKEAKNIIDNDGSINPLKTELSNIFTGGEISLPNFERFIVNNPDYKNVFNDWKKLLDDNMKLSISKLNAFRDTIPINDMRELRMFLINFKNNLKVK